jgi:hypothetical protein
MGKFRLPEYDPDAPDGEPALFVVMLRPGSGYEIAGQGRKSCLTVSAHHTSSIHQTQEGLECVARFPS